MQAVSKRFMVMTMGCCMMLAALAAPSFAQRRGNDSWGNNGRRAEVNNLIRRVEQRSDVFVRLFDRALDNSAMDGTIREERLNERARELARQLDIVRTEFDRHQNFMDIRDNVSQAVNQADQINNVVRNRRLNPRVKQQWSMLRSELNRLALVYRLRPLR